LLTLRQRVRIDLEAYGQRSFRRDAGADAAVLLTGDGFVQLQSVAPEGLAPEGLVSEGPPALIEHRLRIARDLGIEAFFGRRSGSYHCPGQAGCGNDGRDQDSQLHRTLLFFIEFDQHDGIPAATSSSTMMPLRVSHHGPRRTRRGITRFLDAAA